MTKRTIGILTGGGDCPGLNAAIRAITKTAIIKYDWNVVGILDGYAGLIEGRAHPLTFNDVSNILPRGGTILGTSNIANPFAHYENGSDKPIDVTDRVCKNLNDWNIDTLFCIGGDGTMAISDKLRKCFPNIIGLPKTIDNDLLATDQTFGFDTACNFVTESIDRIHSTAQSHHRAMIIEVMGRYAGWIALEGGMAGGGDVILIPEMPFEFEKIAQSVEKRAKHGRKSTIVIVSEGAHPVNESYTVSSVVKDSPDPIRLGGIGKRVADFIEESTGHESRVTVLGHLQRGGSPTFLDRILATRYGFAAVETAAANQFGRLIVLKDGKITSVPLDEATGGQRLVNPEHPFIQSALATGTSFGV